MVSLGETKKHKSNTSKTKLSQSFGTGTKVLDFCFWVSVVVSCGLFKCFEIMHEDYAKHESLPRDGFYGI